MMARLFRDPLLSMTGKLLRIGYILCFALAGLMVLILAIGLFTVVFPSRLADPTIDHREAVVFTLGLLPVAAFYGWFLKVLKAIVDTVAAGTPFVRANADRLATMGWLALGVKLVLGAEALALANSLHGVTQFAARYSGPSLVTVLVLFILARVFREGAAMHDDLEGTV